jgi:DNA-binding NtrC family response regulator
MKARSPGDPSRIPQVLVLFPSFENRAELLQAISKTGMAPRHCGSFEDARRAMKNEDINIVVCEDRIAQKTFEKTLQYASERVTPLPVIVASRTGEWAEFLSALRQGAFDYLILPPRFDEVKRVLGLALAQSSCCEGVPVAAAIAQAASASGGTCSLAEYKGIHSASSFSALSTVEFQRLPAGQPAKTTS